MPKVPNMSNVLSNAAKHSKQNLPRNNNSSNLSKNNGKLNDSNNDNKAELDKSLDSDDNNGRGKFPLFNKSNNSNQNSNGNDKLKDKRAKENAKKDKQDMRKNRSNQHTSDINGAKSLMHGNLFNGARNLHGAHNNKIKKQHNKRDAARGVRSAPRYQANNNNQSKKSKLRGTAEEGIKHAPEIGRGLIAAWLAFKLQHLIQMLMAAFGKALDFLKHIWNGIVGAGKFIGSALGYVTKGIGHGVMSLAGGIGHIAATTLGLGAHGAATVSHAALAVMACTTVSASTVGAYTGAQYLQRDQDPICQVGTHSGGTPFQANFKLKGSKIAQGIEKWCASQHLDAAHTAAILGSAMQESSMGDGGHNMNLLGWSNPSGTNADHSHDTNNISEYLTSFVHHEGQPSAPAAFNKFKKMSGSPESLEEYWGHKIEVCGVMGNRVQFAKHFYAEIAGGSTSGISSANDTADANDQSASKAEDASCDVSSSSGSTADGTGSIKEKANSEGVMNWPFHHIPADIKQYIPDPQKLGMHWGSGTGWYNPGGECVHFASSYFHLIWHTKQKPMVDVGRNEASDWAKAMGGHTSSTPHAGSVVSWVGQPLATGPGHTFIVVHVLSNGDILCLEQNMVDWGHNGAGSGDDQHKPETWDVLLVTKKCYTEHHATFFTPKGKPKFS